MTTEQAIQEAIDRIEYDLTEELSVKELAEGVGYSPWHFSRLFVQYIGMGPSRYVRRRRLTEAALMHLSGYTLYDAAAATGFSSISVLARAFKETFGCTTGQFKREEVHIELQQRAQIVRINLNWRELNMKDIRWIDRPSDQEPFIHSYPAAIYSALVAQGEDISMIDVMGYSGFAFRLDMHKAMCLSASSVFDFNATFSFALSNLGYDARRITRLWHQMSERDERREQAISAIKRALKSGQSPVVWDCLLPEWGIIIGYEEEEDAFACIGPAGMSGALRAQQLGQREIEIMDVTILGARTQLKSEVETLRDVIQWAVDHGRGKHWCDRPTYAQGLDAWTMWHNAMVQASAQDTEHSLSAMHYFGSMVCSARRHAAHFLRLHGRSHQDLLMAAELYETLVDRLQPMVLINAKDVTDDTWSHCAEAIKQAMVLEQRAIEYLEAFLRKI